MSPSARVVLPELLDDLAPDDPRAARSRRDLQRVHRTMGSVSILRRAVARLRLAAPPRRILELGAGDGTLLLRLARALNPWWSGVELTLLDRHDLLSPKTRAAYRQLDWELRVVCADALAWADDPGAQRYDLCITTLFLHHFDAAALNILLPAIAAATESFVACEPRRDGVSRLGSRLIGILGVNGVTRSDAATSVAAGFAARELTSIWPQAKNEWIVDEFPAPPFTHCFTAVRASAQAFVNVHGR